MNTWKRMSEEQPPTNTIVVVVFPNGSAKIARVKISHNHKTPTLHILGQRVPLNHATHWYPVPEIPRLGVAS